MGLERRSPSEIARPTGSPGAGCIDSSGATGRVASGPRAALRRPHSCSHRTSPSLEAAIGLTTEERARIKELERENRRRLRLSGTRAEAAEGGEKSVMQGTRNADGSCHYDYPEVACHRARPPLKSGTSESTTDAAGS